jgi:sugar phosphate isomerase/epimerase
MDRRTFVGALGASVGGVVAARRLPWPGGSGDLRRIGLELYSVRNEMKRDPEGTLHRIRALGYDDVELLWSWDNFGRTPRQVRASLDREGMKAPSAHLAPEALLTDWSRSLDEAALIGQQYLIVPSLPDETKTSIDAWLRWADRFNEAGRAARSAGLWLAFHNEPDHLTPIDGTVPYDVFVARTDPDLVRLQLDIGNLVMGGGDPLTYLNRYRDRYWTFHVKDVLADRSHDTELGRGVVDVAGFLRAVPDLSDKPCFVEQEGSPDPLASAGQNYRYLAKLVL